MEIKYRKSVLHQTVGGEDMETEVMLPDFGDEQEQRPIGIWGQRHLRYIREHRVALYTELLTCGRLNAHLANLNEEAEAMLSRLVKQLAEKEGVTGKAQSRGWYEVGAGYEQYPQPSR